MTCNNCKKNPVWSFTNKIQLCKSCFNDYFERKVFSTIRKKSLFGPKKEFKVNKDNSINSNVLFHVLKKKFDVKFSNKPNISSEDLSQLAEKIFLNILKGDFNSKFEDNSPLCFLSSKEIKLYSKIKKIKGIENKEDKKIQDLFNRFNKKNPDLDHNILNAFYQLKSLNEK